MKPVVLSWLERLSAADSSVKHQQPASSLLCGRPLASSFWPPHPSLGNEVCNVLLQVVHAAAHVVSSPDDLVGHGLKFILPLLQKRLHPP